MQAIKLIVSGDGGVGKTCMLISYTTNEFPGEYIPTVFDDYDMNVMLDGKIINLSLWDTSNRESFDRIRYVPYAKSDVIVTCFSVVNRTNFENIKTKWMIEYENYVSNIPVLLCGTKIDLREDEPTLKKLKERNQKVITYDEGVKLAKEVGCFGYVECSALTQQGLKNVFDTAARRVISPPESSKKKKKSNLFGWFSSWLL